MTPSTPSTSEFWMSAISDLSGCAPSIIDSIISFATKTGLALSFHCSIRKFCKANSFSETIERPRALRWMMTPSASLKTLVLFVFNLGHDDGLFEEGEESSDNFNIFISLSIW
eukprot:CAMPEP_0197008320 /NCGR_PEP_ID=MMETSP1380-20130617/44765_1 /TAXON_ID=5936 /ORGANISM="Euplotes crassus, Strain CT5" /LENGTH=112 /DNA_ID=CAMNT_0042428863 /DNA_START=498 /DNA_END=833 /DNA_ORIENTATION=-